MALSDGMEALARTVARSRARDETPRLMWGQVAAAGPPATVVLDGDQSDSPRPVSGSAVGPVSTGQRVLLARQGRRLWIVNAPAAPWVPLDLANGWEHYVGFGRPEFRVTPEGVQLRGLIRNGTGRLITTLPVAPSQQHIYSLYTGNGMVRIDSFPSGNLSMQETPSTWVSLSSLPIIPLD